jgi:hypothetical protein
VCQLTGGDARPVVTFMARDQRSADGTGRAERERLLGPLLDDVDALAAKGLATMRAELPAYAVQSDEFFEDVLDQIRRNTSALLTALMEDRAPTSDDLAFQRGASMRRARAGFALEDYLSAYRVGQQVLWDSIVAFAAEAGGDNGVVLTLASELMRHMNFATTHAGQAYVEFHQTGLAAVAKEQRDLLEHLLAGALPNAGPLAAAAERCGLGAATRALVAVARPRTPGSDADALELAGATFSRAGLQEPPPLVVIREAEIVMILGVGADRDPGAVCARLERAHAPVCREGTPLAIGVSTIAEGVVEFPRAYREAVSALQFVSREGGVAALTQLTPFEYLALNADETAHRLIEPKIVRFLAEDRRRGGALVDTLRAYSQADLNFKTAGVRLHVHTNTARYRLARVEELTGLNPRRFEDLHALLVAIAVDEQANSRQ